MADKKMMAKGRKKLGQSGFSLLEAVVGGAVVMVIMLGLASVMNFSGRVAQSTKLSSDFNNLVSMIQMIISNETLCANTFSSFSFTPPTGAGLPINISPAQTVSPLSANGSVIAEVSSAATGLKVTKIEFNKLLNNTLPPQNGKNHYLVNLHLEAEKAVAGGAVGSATTSADLPLSILTDPVTRQIVGCYGQSSPTQICQDMGGTYNVSGTPRCSGVDTGPLKVARALVYGRPGNFTFTVPAGVSEVLVEVWGGGGGGGHGCALNMRSPGSGGGSGSYSRGRVAVTPGQTYPVVVGAAGAAAAASCSGGAPLYDGGNGAASSFNGTVVANGGRGGRSLSNGFITGGTRPLVAPGGVAAAVGSGEVTLPGKTGGQAPNDLSYGEGAEGVMPSQIPGYGEGGRGAIYDGTGKEAGKAGAVAIYFEI